LNECSEVERSFVGKSQDFDFLINLEKAIQVIEINPLIFKVLKTET
jgi:hypothetical protein